MFLICSLWFTCTSFAQVRQPDLNNMDLEDLTKVQVDTVSGASKFLENSTDVPASVTVVMGDEIREFGVPHACGRTAEHTWLRRGGGMVQLTMENKQVHFTINLGVASREELRIRSGLLALSKIIGSAGIAPTESGLAR